MNRGESRSQRTGVMMIERKVTQGRSAAAKRMVTMGCASERERTRRAPLTETGITVRTQYQLQKERL
jgi:hypothetical protein